MVKDDVLAPLPQTDLRVHLVWVPILDSDTQAAAEEAMAAMPKNDPRIHQYWDTGGQLATALGRVLGIPPRRGDAAASSPSSSGASGLAWDVYLLYPRQARWPAAGAPPAPARWMHQLNQVTSAQAPFLDGSELRRWVGAPLPGH
ncbi:MAG TPA: hypothetical protein VH877_06350 [Polyangia bacterium]|nr:hypothetical protein [Polyangia bacterium]